LKLKFISRKRYCSPKCLKDAVLQNYKINIQQELDASARTWCVYYTQIIFKK